MTASPATSDTVTLSDAAAARVAAIAAKQGRPAFLRLSVEGGGCSGFTYKFDLADSPEADDNVTHNGPTGLIVDTISLDLLKGSVVDFVENLGGASFQVTNPNAAAGCGCGSSFSV